jgi:hypothetical protein
VWSDQRLVVMLLQEVRGVSIFHDKNSSRG